MTSTESANINASRRSWALGLGLALAVGTAGVCWHWNRIVHLPDPDIVIHTESEAVAGAREFLAAVKINSNAYDISHVSSITRDRMKGRVVWRIVWLAQPGAKTTNKLSVLAGETGWFHTIERVSSNQYVVIEGVKTNQHNFVILRNPSPGVSRSQLDLKQ